MGAYDGAEVCELVGFFNLHQLSRVYNNNNIGLYRDDSLAVFKNISGTQAEKIKKHFQNIFRKNNLNIIVKCNLKVVDYLDVTLNLSDGLCKPFHKPNSEINYIHRASNHPPTIIKQLPLSVESRLSKLSSDENVFILAASVYQEALKRAGYNHKLKYKNSDKYNSNNNNNQHICNSNDTKNDNNYDNNKFKFDHNDKWDKDNNNNKDNFNGYENEDGNYNVKVKLRLRLSSIAMIIGVILTIITTIILLVMITGIILKIKILIIVIIVVIITIIIWTVIIIIIQGKETET